MRQSRIEGEEISDAQATADRDNGADMARVIVVGVDGSGPGERGFVWLSAEGRLRDGLVPVVNAWEVPPPTPTGTAFAPVHDPSGE
jgi:hypothetical protein